MEVVRRWWARVAGRGRTSGDLCGRVEAGRRAEDGKRGDRTTGNQKERVVMMPLT